MGNNNNFTYTGSEYLATGVFKTYNSTYADFVSQCPGASWVTTPLIVNSNISNLMKSETVFIEVFGSNPVMKVLDFLITFQLFDYPLTEIAKNSEVSYSTLQTFWKNLEKNNIVIKTRRVGKSDLYKLNTNNPAVKQLIKLDWNLTKGVEVNA